MGPVQAVAVLFGFTLLVDALYVAWRRDSKLAERAVVELRSVMWRRRAWWLSPIGIMLFLLLAFVAGSTQPGWVTWIYNMF